MKQNDRLPASASHALVVRDGNRTHETSRALAVLPPLHTVPFERRPSRRVSRLFSVLTIPALFAAGGYLANDPDVRRIASYQMTMLTSPGVSLAEPSADGGDLQIGPIPRHANYLFVEGKKGPRADRYFVSLNKTAVEKQGGGTSEVRVVSANDLVQRRSKAGALTLASAAVENSEAARPENAGLMASASFFVMAAPTNDGLFNALAPGGGTSTDDNAGWAKLIRNASLSPEQPKTIFGGLTEEEFREREVRCMATAIYFESRGEPTRGQIAVGQVVMNRIRSPIYPKTICGVIYQGHLNRNACQFSFACDGKPDRPTNKEQWAASLKVAKQVISREVWLDDIGYSTHYHADYVKPDWRHMYERVTQIGVHIFYRPPPGAVQVALAVD
jgi:spore germination cell wall hydrolase CwlJ-like protein